VLLRYTRHDASGEEEETWSKEGWAGTYLGNVINGDDVLVGMLIRLVDDGLDGSGIVLAWHCGWCCCWYGYSSSSDRCN
jgi:hypothetical protein